MGDEFQLGNGSWWDTTRNRSFDSGTTPPAASGGGGHDQSSGDGGTLADQNLQMMGLGLSTQNLDWNQALIGGEKVESSFRSLLQEDYQHHHQKLYSGPSSDDSSVNEFKQINRLSFNLDQTTPFSSQAAASSNDSAINTGFQVDLQGMLLPDNNQSTYQNRPQMNYQYPASGGYAAELNKYPQFLRTSQPQPQPPSAAASGSHLHFTNNTPFWNAAAPAPADMANGGSSFFPVAHQIPPPPSFDDNSKNLSAITKKNSIEASNKRPRVNEAPTPVPAFKAKKEKMGDRITALQQLVSPFGKTDTASVLSEAIAYIKFLHEQVSVLSNPYMKNGAPIQHQQKTEKSNEAEGARQDLRSRGLCLVPVSSTFPMTHETTVDFWTPTFGGSFR
ncbi:hypothetical protein CASFOL_014873 [Castilleja foliolosa]|uniref:BHLH domain-containing protein n=1 Tax=Castilleja foliolosa TaxID=1961234 RepID=A0ABD3DC57_9LAMI